ncbi:MAG: hypothetical protein IKL15_01185 [Mycoplasmataceae bacterium]|nr:hypothetical protein [Mycoplasmataceae bacterium]MBR2999011.1 hypothetical protein [Mycoplasmataceae bacterium]MBR3571265.1 hypothetical protein [Mycoplasmataceae bacterium]MBR4025547.1 hypothetical protein [Mycoplasmataceae bacterium]
MPYIVKKVEIDTIKLDNTKTLVLGDKEKKPYDDEEINVELDEISYKQILEFQKKIGYGNKKIKQLIKINEQNKEMVYKHIDNIQEFYAILWERTIIELMFISQYYSSLISEHKSFEQILRGVNQFEFWFNNNVKYNMLIKIRNFYFKIAEICANKTTLNIYETDVEQRVKLILQDIEKNHLVQIKEFLHSKWDESFEKHKEWLKTRTEKRKTILFD